MLFKQERIRFIQSSVQIDSDAIALIVSVARTIHATKTAIQLTGQRTEKFKNKRKSTILYILYAIYVDV